MEAQYPGKCAACGEEIEIGDEIEMNEDEEWCHVDCALEADGPYLV